MKYFEFRQVCDGVIDCTDCTDEINEGICPKQNAKNFFVCKEPIGLGNAMTRFALYGVDNIYTYLYIYIQ